MVNEREINHDMFHQKLKKSIFPRAIFTLYRQYLKSKVEALVLSGERFHKI